MMKVQLAKFFPQCDRVAYFLSFFIFNVCFIFLTVFPSLLATYAYADTVTVNDVILNKGAEADKLEQTDTAYQSGKENDNFVQEFNDIDDLDEWTDGDGENDQVYDPLESVNRFFFQFNDKLYFWGLKPVAEGYAWIFPEVVRESIDNFFYNIFTPIRAANCILQLNFQGLETEISRLLINTTVGIAGFMDPAYDRWQISRVYEDFGQTLGVYGVDFGPYIVIPFLGPSGARDAVGLAVDSFLNPVNYYFDSLASQAAIRGSWTVNERSMKIGEYEALKESAIDPYIAMRSAYYQFRENLVNDQPSPFGTFIAK